MSNGPIRAFEGLSQMTKDAIMLIATEARVPYTRARIISASSACETLLNFTVARLYNQSFHQLILDDEGGINTQWQNYNFDLETPWQGKLKLRTRSGAILSASVAANKIGQDHGENFFVLRFTVEPEKSTVEQNPVALDPVSSAGTVPEPVPDVVKTPYVAPTAAEVVPPPVTISIPAAEQAKTEISTESSSHSTSEYERLEAVLHYAPAGIFRMQVSDDADKKFLYISASHKYEQMTGVSASAIAGKSPHDIMPADQADHVTSKLRQCIETRKTFVFEAIIDLPVGRRWLQTTIVPLADETGRIVELTGVSQDISDRKSAAEELAEKIDEQAAIYELSQLALTQTNLSVLLNKAVEIISQAMNLGYCKIQQYSSDQQSMLLIAGIGWNQGLVGTFTSSIWDNTQSAAALKSLAPIVVENFDEETRFVRSPLLAEHGIKSGLTVVISGLSGPFGILSVHSQEPRVFDEDQVHFLQSAADTLANAIKNTLSEQALRESERLVSSILESAQIGIGVSDESGRFVRVNQAFCKIFGYDSKDLLGREFTTLLPFSEHQNARQVYSDFMKSGIEMPGEGTCLRSDGRPVEVQITAGRLERADGSMLRVTTVEDITSRKNTENSLKLFQFAALNSHDGIVITEPGPIDGSGPKIIFCNAAATNITGYTRDEILGGYLRLFQGPETEDARAKDIQNAMRQRKTADIELILHRKDQTPYWAQVGVIPVNDLQGKHMNWLITFRDITSRMQQQQFLESSKDQAITASQAKSDFLAGISHEIRTPLNAIIGFADVLRREIFGPIGHDRYRAYAEDIHDSGRHLLQLVNNTLDLSKIEAGVVELHESEIPMEAVVRSSVALMRDNAQNAKIQLVVDLPDDLPLLRGDETKVKQILLNMLSNAVKYTLPGGSITVKCFVEPRGLALQVKDTGVGIPEAEIPKVMQKYMQANNEQNKHATGTGLGIPVTKSLIELHQGILELESKEKIGTTISAIFPNERLVKKQSRPFPSHKLAS